MAVRAVETFVRPGPNLNVERQDCASCLLRQKRDGPGVDIEAGRQGAHGRSLFSASEMRRLKGDDAWRKWRHYLGVVARLVRARRLTRPDEAGPTVGPRAAGRRHCLPILT